jgi:hypothetical protein
MVNDNDIPLTIGSSKRRHLNPSETSILDEENIDVDQRLIPALVRAAAPYFHFSLALVATYY